MTSEVLEKELIDKVSMLKKSFVGSISIVMSGIFISAMINKYYPFTAAKNGGPNELLSGIPLKH